MASYNFGNNTNQQSGHAGGMGGLAQDLGIASSYQANPANQGAYQDFANSQQGNQNNFIGQANAAQGHAGPDINNQYQGQSRAGLAGVQSDLGSIGAQARGMAANPYDSQAQHQFQQGLDQSINAQMATANSARGGALAQNAARRQAAMGGAQAMANQNAAAAEQADKDQFAALGLGAQVAGQQGQLGMQQYGLEQTDAQRQAEMQLQQEQVNNQLTGEYLGAAGQSGALTLGGINGSTGAQNAASATNAGVAAGAGAAGNQLFGQIMGAAGQGMGTALGGAGGPPMYPGGEGMPSSATPPYTGGPATGVGGVPTSYDGNGLPPDFSDPKLKKELRSASESVRGAVSRGADKASQAVNDAREKVGGLAGAVMGRPAASDGEGSIESRAAVPSQGNAPKAGEWDARATAPGTPRPDQRRAGEWEATNRPQEGRVVDGGEIDGPPLVNTGRPVPAPPPDAQDRRVGLGEGLAGARGTVVMPAEVHDRGVGVGEGMAGGRAGYPDVNSPPPNLTGPALQAWLLQNGPESRDAFRVGGYEAVKSEAPYARAQAAAIEKQRMLASDPKLKKGMRMDTSVVDAFLEHVDPKTFRYKKKRHEPSLSPTGGTYLGVSADDVERAPIIGKQIVKHTSEGKALEHGPAISAALAGLGSLHRRLKKLEEGAQ